MLSTNPAAFMQMMQMQQAQQNGGQMPQYSMPTAGMQGHNPGYAPSPPPDQSGNPYASGGGGGYGGGGRR